MAAFDPQTFDQAWRRYTAAATKAHPNFMSYLNKGATADDIAALEAAVGTQVSPDLRHLLSLHNGCLEAFVLPGWELFSAQRIVDEWKIWEELYRTQFKPEGETCLPSGPICSDEWWRLKWIPFCGDGGGNHLCIDMEPARGGTIGQVITMWHDEPTRALIAPSLTAFIEQIAADFEQGKLVWDEDWGGVNSAA
jgi:cell wall assembly regulator SMI1